MADPPSASAVSPKGVKIESSAMLPTTSRLIRSHPIRGGDAEQAERVGEDDPGGPCEQEPRLLGARALGRADRAGVVVPRVHRRCQLVEVYGDAVRLALAGGL